MNNEENDKKSIELHREHRGKIEIVSKVKLKNRDDLSMAYTPGVAAVSKEIVRDKTLADELTLKGRTVAVVTDGSSVLGLGNIGPLAALPVMEGKAAIFKEFAGVDAFPICLDTQEADEIIETVKRLAPTFAGINLEDISAPRCFEIEDRLQDLGIPVFHDDQHGTAIVVLAGLLNAVKVTGKALRKSKVVISGAGAAGTAIAKLLSSEMNGKGEILVCDRKGVISSRREDLNTAKQSLLAFTNKVDLSGSFKEAIEGADIFIGVSGPGVLTKELAQKMNKDAIIFALSNPVPEIFPDEACEAGARVVATGRSDFPNQVNNALVFPGIFQGALKAKATRITPLMKREAARALAGLIPLPSAEKIIPEIFEKGVVRAVALAVSEAWKSEMAEKSGE